MPKLHIIYDPHDIIVPNPMAEKQMGCKVAIMSIPADLKAIDIYHQAKKLAELLLEQL
jgi:hypothetical protein